MNQDSYGKMNGIFLLSIFCAGTFSSFLTLGIAYIIGFVDTIGFKTELIPVIAGLLSGIVLFTFLGMFMTGRNRTISTITGFLVLFIISLSWFFIMRGIEYTLDYPLFFSITFLLSFSAFFSTALTMPSLLRFKGGSSIIWGFSSSAITIVVIVFAALEYELLGQHTLPLELDTMGIISIILLLLMLSIS